MTELPKVAPVVGLQARVRLSRDYHVRLDGNDYSVDPRLIGRIARIWSLRIVIECVEPIRSAITVAGIHGNALSSARICGSTTSTSDPFGGRSYFGGWSSINAARTVLRSTPSRREAP